MTSGAAVKKHRRGITFLVDAMSLWILGPITFTLCLIGIVIVCFADSLKIDFTDMPDELRLAIVAVPEFFLALIIIKLMRELYLMGQRRRTAPKIKFFPVDHQCWWYATKQSDGMYITAVNTDFKVENLSDRPIRLFRVRITEPKSNMEIVKEGITVCPEGFPEFSSEHAVPPKSTAKMVAHLMIRGLIENITVTIPAVIEITDNNRSRHKIKVLLKCRNKDDALK